MPEASDSDDLGGFADLSESQRWAVSRYRARQVRYQENTEQPTNRDQWDRLIALELEDEARQWRRGGNR